MLSSMNLTNKQRNRKWEKTQKPKIRLVFYNVFHIFTKSLIWSYGRYAHSGIRVRPKTRKNDKFEKRPLFLKNNSPGLKADFPQKVKQSMKSTIHKCTVNVIPVTNPTQYTKLAKSIVKTEIRLLLGIPVSRIFALFPIAYSPVVAYMHVRSEM